MKGKYKAALALLLLLILVPLTLLMTLGLWVPTLAGIWLPVGTRIALEQSPRLTRHGLVIPDLRYLVNDCSLAHITQAELTHPSRWSLNIKRPQTGCRMPGETARYGSFSRRAAYAGAVAVNAAQYLD